MDLLIGPIVGFPSGSEVQCQDILRSPCKEQEKYR
jgi:hypothetical protein